MEQFINFKGNIPTGNYELKVAFGPNWDESYGDNSNNLKLVTLNPSDVVFTIDYSARK